MRKSAFFIGLALWIIMTVLLLAVFQSKRSQPSEQAKTPRVRIRVEQPDIDTIIPDGWQPPLVEGWELTNHNGQTVTPETLRGKPYVATFIFTRCATHCPNLVREVYDLEQRVKDADIRFVTVTVDPDHDTVEHLNAYADVFTKDADRWMFLTGSKEEILDFARYGGRQMMNERPDAETFIGPQAAHSLRLMHVGADGRLIGSYFFQSEQDMRALTQVLLGKSETRDEHKPLPAPEDMAAPAIEDEPVDDAQTTDLDDTANAVGVFTIPNRTMIPVAFLQDGPPSEDARNKDVTKNADPLANLPSWAKALPPINAALNSVATVLLVLAGLAIKRGRIKRHKNLMLTALVISALFLACYLVYHWALGAYTDSHGKPFEGTGVWKTVYYSILIPHVVLAVFVPVLAGMAVWRAYKRRFEAHRKVVRYAYPIWLFVSVTGVVIYGMLYHWPAVA